MRALTMDFPGGKGFLKEDLLRPIEGSGVGKTFGTGKPIVVTKATEISEPDHHLALAESITSGCSLPLIGRNRTLGVLTLGWRDENAFSSEDIEFLMRAAGQVGRNYKKKPK
jgi:formate hydrogenlyase transcriptional activator